jgi:aryl-alcohol dehydrogenase-like predicted oxidoreductase
MVRSVESSLKSLRTEYIDLLYLHAWDFTTPVDEVMRAFDDLVRAGKLEDNLAALDVEWSDEHRRKLESASAVELRFPHDFLKHDLTRQVMFAGANREHVQPD